MKPEYSAFLEELVSKELRGRKDICRSQIMRGMCSIFVNKFVAKFPELTAQAGFYSLFGPEDGEPPGIEHWWCVTPDGQIVDPTVEQFGLVGEYIEYNEDAHQVRLGRCMNCGMDIFGLKSAGHRCVCDEEECTAAMEDM